LRNRQQQQHRRGYCEDFEENYALHLNFPHRNLDAPRYNVWLSIYNTGSIETNSAVSAVPRHFALGGSSKWEVVCACPHGCISFAQASIKVSLGGITPFGKPRVFFQQAVLTSPARCSVTRSPASCLHSSPRYR
jgi:hypothetical protein